MSEQRLTVQRWNAIVSSLNGMLTDPSFNNPDALYNPPGGVGNILAFAPGAAHTAPNIIRLSPVLKTAGDRITKQDIITMDKMWAAYQFGITSSYDDYSEEPFRLSKQRIEDYEARLAFGVDFFIAGDSILEGGPYWDTGTSLIKVGQYLFDKYAAMGSPNARSYNLVGGALYTGAPFNLSFGLVGGIVGNILQDHTSTETQSVFLGGHDPTTVSMTLELMPFQYTGTANFPHSSAWLTFEADLPALLSDEVDVITLPY